jgi:superoxide dismutase, Fe-Mn family
MMTRRQVLKTTVLASVAYAASPSLRTTNAQPAQAPAATAAPGGPFTLPPLPYPFDALEPQIDAQTMQIHHDKHHAAYVANLNKAVAQSPDLGMKPVEDLLKNLDAVPEKIRTAVRNQGGGHYNHSLFWQMMNRNAGGEPSGELAKAIEKNSAASMRSKTNSRRLRWANLGAAGHGLFWTAGS